MGRVRADGGTDRHAGSFRSGWPLRNGDDHITLDVKGNIGSNSAELLRTFAVNGLGIVRPSDIHIGPDIESGRLVRVLEGLQQAVLTLVQAKTARLTDTAALFQALGAGWWNRPDAVAAGSLSR